MRLCAVIKFHFSLYQLYDSTWFQKSS